MVDLYQWWMPTFCKYGLEGYLFKMMKYQYGGHQGGRYACENTVGYIILKREHGLWNIESYRAVLLQLCKVYGQVIAGFDLNLLWQLADNIPWFTVSQWSKWQQVDVCISVNISGNLCILCIKWPW